MKDYSEFTDKHASQRDRKQQKRVDGRLMRGNRSVFEMEKAQHKRDRKTIRHMQDENE